MRFLIIRLSSMGDIIQCSQTATELKKKYPEAEIHWLVRSDFEGILKANQDIDKIWSFNKKLGLFGFIQLCFKISKSKYTHIYDAHSNIRSHIASAILFLLAPSFKFIRRSKERIKRIKLFYFGKNEFPQPFKGTDSFISPLAPWGLKVGNYAQPNMKWAASQNIQPHMEHIKHSIVIAPSAAWELKRWPIEYWQQLLKTLGQYRFSIIAGPEDKFCEQLTHIDSERIVNFSGTVNWLDTFQIIHSCRLLISGDSGTAHMADYLHKNCIEIIGPSAFGYPARPSTHVLETELDCKPCSKDGRNKCTNKTYKKCMYEVSPAQVRQKVQEILNP